jgi:hypothetical protein
MKKAMKMKIWVLLLPNLLMAGSLAQAQERLGDFAKFKPRYAGMSAGAGFMFSPGLGSAFYLAPRLNFQVTPRFHVHTGINIIQYSLLPAQMAELSRKTPVTGAYVFTEGVYLLNERWSVNGSVMKSLVPKSMQTKQPFRLPAEAIHLGIDYRVTPHVTVGARIGYSSGTRSFGNARHPLFLY